MATRVDFEDEIQRNRRWTWVLLGASFLLLAIIAAAITFALDAGWFGLAIGLALSLGLTLMAFFQADSLALGSTGARPAPIEQFPQLHNLVESMSISAGIPKPRVYVVDDPAPNAFATGRDHDHAAVAVTTGLLQRMNRDELEGVIAHELAHIRNYDIRVMTVAVATAGSIAVITDVFWRMMFWGAIAGSGRRRSDSKGGGANPLALIALVVVAVLAPIAAALLKAAISRQREQLADATAVKLTRYPSGLRKALEKLDADSTVVRRTSHATSHLWIESPDDTEEGHKGARLNSMFRTHPPLSERIDLLRRMEGLPPYTGPSPELLADLERRSQAAQHEAAQHEAAQSEAAQREAAHAASSSAAHHPPLRQFGDRPAADSMPQLDGLFDAQVGSQDGARRGSRRGRRAGKSNLPPPPAPPGSSS